MLPALSPVSIYFHSPQIINTKEAPTELDDGTIRTKVQPAAKATQTGNISTPSPKTSVSCEGQVSSCGRTARVEMKKG